MEERFQVDQHRVLPRRDQVLEVEIGRLQCIQQRQVAALALIETPDLVRGGAALGGDEFDPSVGPTIENLQRPEWGVIAAIVEPG